MQPELPSWPLPPSHAKHPHSNSPLPAPPLPPQTHLVRGRRVLVAPRLLAHGGALAHACITSARGTVRQPKGRDLRCNVAGSPPVHPPITVALARTPHTPQLPPPQPPGAVARCSAPASARSAMRVGPPLPASAGRAGRRGGGGGGGGRWKRVGMRRGRSAETTEGQEPCVRHCAWTHYARCPHVCRCRAPHEPLRSRLRCSGQGGSRGASLGAMCGAGGGPRSQAVRPSGTTCIPPYRNNCTGTVHPLPAPRQPLAHPSLWPSPRVAVVLALPPCPSAGVGVEGCNSWMHPDPLRHQGITRGRGAVQFQRCCSWGRWGRDPKGTPPPRCARKHLRRRRQWRSLSCCPHQKPRPRLPGLVGGSSGC